MWFLLYLALLPLCFTTHCRSTLSDPYSKMSTKTGYSQFSQGNSYPEKIEAENCSFVHLWTVVRHGTRYPSKEAIRLMNEQLPVLKDRILRAAEDGLSLICPEDLALFRNWTIDVKEEQAKLLHPEGEQEMILLGERWLQRFPDLLAKYEKDLFRLRSTNTQRSQLSGRSFTTGLWTRPISQKVQWEQVLKPHDPILRFYKVCNKWKKDVKKNPDSLKERQLFEKSNLMSEVKLNISNFLGLKDPILSMADLDMMYVMCNFDSAWNPVKSSPWCALFSNFQLRIMEYREELEYFWVDGPGYPVSYEQACVLAKDMGDTFTDLVKGRSVKRGTFYFTHSGTVLKLLAFLGIGNKSAMTNDNVMSMMNTTWTTSDYGPFGANIAFVLQKCEGMQWRVGLWVNEILTLIPGCEELWCRMEDLLENFPQISDCDFDAICADDSDVHIDLPDDKY